jgi:hypothetical protein
VPVAEHIQKLAINTCSGGGLHSSYSYQPLLCVPQLRCAQLEVRLNVLQSGAFTQNLLAGCTAAVLNGMIRQFAVAVMAILVERVSQGQIQLSSELPCERNCKDCPVSVTQCIRAADLALVYFSWERQGERLSSWHMRRQRVFEKKHLLRQPANPPNQSASHTGQ